MADLTVRERRERADRYIFRGVHPHARFGTASDRYAGWIGQIYSTSFAERVSTRRRKLEGKTFEERTVPVESVREYFQHFDVLEIDFTFYRQLVENGRPTNNFTLLQEYAHHAPRDARFLLKAPQTFFARKLRRGSAGQTHYEDNANFLDASSFEVSFLRPAVDILGDRLAGILFEQEYQRKSETPDPVEIIAELDVFFGDIANGVQAHLEIRSPHLLVPAYFDWLQARGLGFVFSHWTWLPPIRDQWRLSGSRFTAADRSVVVRLLTPLRMPYAKAYALCHPFDRPVPELADSRQTQYMVLDVTALIYQAEDQAAFVNVITNNRAYGNAPELGRYIAHRILDEEEKRAGA